MTKRPLSMTPANVERRERQQLAKFDKGLAEWSAKVLAHMKANGVSFDEAFVACGGTIIPLEIAEENAK